MQMRFAFVVAGLAVTSCKKNDATRPPAPPVRVVEAPKPAPPPLAATSIDAGPAPSHDAGAVVMDAGTAKVDAGVPVAGQAGKKPATKKGNSK